MDSGATMLTLFTNPRTLTWFKRHKRSF